MMTDALGAELVAERARAAIASLQLPHPSSPHHVVTVSVGVSTWIAGEQGQAQALLAQADTALYRAKERGRNLTCHAGALRRSQHGGAQAISCNGELRRLTDRVEQAVDPMHMAAVQG